MSTRQKHKILDAFLAQLGEMAHAAIERGEDAGDPLAQVRAACDELEAAFERAKRSGN